MHLFIRFISFFCLIQPLCAYQEPVLHKVPFSAESISLSQEEKGNLSADLIRTASTLESPDLLGNRLLALALFIHPRNQEGILLNHYWKNQIKPENPNTALTKEELSKKLFEKATGLIKNKKEGDLKFSAYLLNIAHQLSPSHEDAKFQLELLQKNGVTADWNVFFDASISNETEEPPPEKANEFRQTLVWPFLTPAQEKAPPLQTTEISLVVTPHKKNDQLTRYRVFPKYEEIGTTLETIVQFIKSSADWDIGRVFTISLPSREISFSPDKSEGLALYILMRCALEDYPLREKLSAIGHITPEGQLLPTAWTFQRLQLLVQNKINFLLLCSADRDVINDILLEQPDLASAIQIFAPAHPNQAWAAAKKQGPAEESVKLFQSIQEEITATSLEKAITNPAIIEKLRKILQQTPYHLSAECLYRLAIRSLPPHFSLEYSCEKLLSACGEFSPFLLNKSSLKTSDPSNEITRVSDAVYKNAYDAMSRIQSRLHPKSVALKQDLRAYLDAHKQVTRASSKLSGNSYRLLLQHREGIQALLIELTGDPSLDKH